MNNLFGIINIKIKCFKGSVYQADSLEKEVNEFLELHNGNILDVKIGNGKEYFSGDSLINVVVLYKEEPAENQPKKERLTLDERIAQSIRATEKIEAGKAYFANKDNDRS